MEATELELIETESLLTLSSARAVVVLTADDYVRAGEFIVDCKSLIAKIKSEFAEPKRKADEAHKSICAMEGRALKPVQDAVAVVSTVAGEWKREQDRIAKEEHDRQEAERKRLLQEEQLKEAAVLEQWGETEAAAAKLNYAVLPKRNVKFESPVPKVAGLSTKKKWKGRILDPHYVARLYCMPDQTLVNAAVAQFFAYNPTPTPEQLSELVTKLGGPKAVEIYEEEVFAGRSAHPQRG